MCNIIISDEWWLGFLSRFTRWCGIIEVPHPELELAL